MNVFNILVMLGLLTVAGHAQGDEFPLTMQLRGLDYECQEGFARRTQLEVRAGSETFRCDLTEDSIGAPVDIADGWFQSDRDDWCRLDSTRRGGRILSLDLKCIGRGRSFEASYLNKYVTYSNFSCNRLGDCSNSDRSVELFDGKFRMNGRVYVEADEPRVILPRQTFYIATNNAAAQVKITSSSFGAVRFRFLQTDGEWSNPIHFTCDSHIGICQGEEIPEIGSSSKLQYYVSPTSGHTYLVWFHQGIHMQAYHRSSPL